MPEASHPAPPTDPAAGSTASYAQLETSATERSAGARTIITCYGAPAAVQQVGYWQQRDASPRDPPPHPGVVTCHPGAAQPLPLEKLPAWPQQKNDGAVPGDRIDAINRRPRTGIRAFAPRRLNP